VKADNYSAWDINPKNFPSNGTMREQLLFIAGYGVLAPSTHNSQPWKVELGESSITLRPNMEVANRLKQVDPQYRQLGISLGSFVANVQIAAEYFGLSVTKQYAFKTFESGSVVMIFKKKLPNKEYYSLVQAMPKRRSNKSMYAEESLSDELRNKITTKNLKIIEENQDKQKLAELYLGAAKEFSTRPFTEELVSWMRPPDTRAYDGMPSSVQGMKKAQFIVGRFLMPRVPKLLEKVAQADHLKIINSSGIAIVYSDHDGLVDWVKAGEAMERFILTCIASGLNVTIMQAAIESKGSRDKLPVYMSGKYPQVFLRLGYATIKNAPHTPRKPLMSFIIE